VLGFYFAKNIETRRKEIKNMKLEKIMVFIQILSAIALTGAAGSIITAPQEVRSFIVLKLL
jgi:hypothetical protein